jgi:hypothetical protein
MDRVAVLVLVIATASVGNPHLFPQVGVLLLGEINIRQDHQPWVLRSEVKF